MYLRTRSNGAKKNEHMILAVSDKLEEYDVSHHSYKQQGRCGLTFFARFCCASDGCLMRTHLLRRSMGGWEETIGALKSIGRGAFAIAID